MPGLGAVATTTIAGVHLVRKGLSRPIGSLTQMGSLQVAGRNLPIKECVPLAELEQLEFGGWDLFPDDGYEAARKAAVLEQRDLEQVREELQRVRPMSAAFYPDYVRRLSGPNVKRAESKAEMVEQLRDDIRRFMRTRECSRAVAVWCGSTEVFQKPTPVHGSVEAFERGLMRDDEGISNAQLYAWAAMKEGVPFANGAPHLGCDFPAAWELSRKLGVPIAGNDFKTGQTLLKTALAPALRSRQLGVRGWFSTNILGNRDGEVLDDPQSFRTKEKSKLGALETILDAEQSPELYGDMTHKVRIEYYPPRGDAKEAWDNIDLFGWLGYSMQLKINFLCRDSILAAPVVLDLALLLDLAQRAGLAGRQDWLGYYFKAPMCSGSRQVHDLFEQEAVLTSTLRDIMGAPSLELEAETALQ
ncbi:MAG: inositol-3-phosphate synthase [Myxococcales bacterium]